MKKYYLFAGLVLLAASPAFAQTKIGAPGAPDASAMLEVTSGTGNNKGLLMPRMTTAQRNAITSPATGLMIYNTTTNEAQVNTGTPASPTWTAATAAASWTTAGNTGTSPATNFIGTTDNQPLTIRTNNTEQMRVTPTGSVGIGINAPATKLHVNTGALRISNGSTALTLPAIEVINDGGGNGSNDNIVISSYGTSSQPSIGTQSSRGTAALPENSQAGDNIGNFFFNSRVNGSIANSNVIRGVYLGDGTTNKSRLNFFSSNTLAMSLDSNQNVGIGTSSPLVKLQVVDSGDADIRVLSTTASSNGRMRVTLGNSFHGMVRNLISSGGLSNDVALYTSSGPGAGASLYLAANPTATDSLNLNQFALKSNGNVGVGIKDPVTKLHVNSGALRISNGSTTLANPAIQVINDGGGNTNNDNIVIQSYGASTAPSIGTFVSRGTLATPANNQAGDNMGNFYSGARVNGVQTTINQIGNIYLGDGTINKSRMTFTTSNTLAMQIDSNQDVRITGKLNVGGGVLVRRDVNFAYSNASLHTWNMVNSGLGETEFINYRGSGSGGFRFFNVDQSDTASSANDIATINSAGVYTQLSDMRLKTNVNIVDDGLEKVMALRPVTYDFHTGKTLKDGVVAFTKNDMIVPSIGFLAQELAKVVPEAVEVPKDPANELYKVSYASVVPVLTKAIQEQQAQIEVLKAKNEQLEAANKVTAQLIERVKQMEQMMGIKEIEGTSKVAGK